MGLQCAESTSLAFACSALSGEGVVVVVGVAGGSEPAEGEVPPPPWPKAVNEENKVLQVRCPLAHAQ